MTAKASFQSWLAALLFAGAAGVIGYSIPRGQPSPEIASANLGVGRIDTNAPSSDFKPPPDSAIPDNEFGKMVLKGRDIFTNTGSAAKEFVGNDLRCSNCHIDAGRLPNSAPLWGAFVAFPTYRDKNGHVNTFEERMQGCFKYSMNGKAPPMGHEVLVALESYAYFLAKGAPTGASLKGRGYPELPKAANLDRVHGQQVYAQNCSVCHGADGQGQKDPTGHVVFPPLWGDRSYNWGAGMSSIKNASGFIKANMPLSQGGSLSDQDAWDVAAYIDGKERPQDPRFTGDVAATRQKYHDSKLDLYGTEIDGKVLGQP